MFRMYHIRIVDHKCTFNVVSTSFVIIDVVSTNFDIVNVVFDLVLFCYMPFLWRRLPGGIKLHAGNGDPEDKLIVTRLKTLVHPAAISARSEMKRSKRI